MVFFCPRKRPRLGPKWQLLTKGPWRIEKVLNSVNYVIRRVGGRDHRLVHIDRLQRYDMAAPDNADLDLTSRSIPEGKNFTSRPKQECGDGISQSAGERCGHLDWFGGDSVRRVSNVRCHDGGYRRQPPAGKVDVYSIGRRGLYPTALVVPSTRLPFGDGSVHTPLQGPELDTLNTLVALAVLFIVSLVRDFRRRAKMAPIVPGTSGQRNFTPCYISWMRRRTERFLQGCWPTTPRSSPTMRLREDTTRPNRTNSGRDEFEFGHGGESRLSLFGT